MTKTIVILLDGTSNEIARNRTHVLRLYGCLDKSDDQIVYYDPGVGTFGSEDSFFGISRKVSELVGLITGWGLQQNVKEAYRFLAATWDPGDPKNGIAPDRIVLAGFSRGAYTARVLAGFLHTVGLFRPNNLNLLDYAFRSYWKISEHDHDTGDRKPSQNPFAEVRLFERVLQAPKPVIDVMMLFDTVGSIIEWSGLRPKMRRYAFTARNPSVRHVRHAVAIDERRTMYNPLLWRGVEFWRGQDRRPDDPDEQDVNEVWFSGVHGDIGGGVPEERSQLGKVVLHWMIEQTRPLGLSYRDDVVRAIVLGEGGGKYVAPSPVAPRNESMTWVWWLLECWPRSARRGSTRRGFLGHYLPWGARRDIPEGAKIDSSVWLRKGTGDDFDQPNLPEAPSPK